MKKQKEHYVNNKDFFEAMCVYKEAVEKANNTDSARPHVSNYIGDCIMKIATRLSRKGNFRNYPFIEEMIGDGIENALMYIDNFAPYRIDKEGKEVKGNPFAYFTQIIYFAFLRRIAKEKKFLYTKYKIMENTEFHNSKDVLDDTRHQHKIEHNDYSQEYISDFIQNFEQNKRKEINKRNKV